MSEIIGRYLDMDGVRSYYETCGSGPALLLLHPAGRDNRQWHGVIEALGAHFTCYAPDLPGHGKTMPRPGNVCFNDVHDILDWQYRFIQSVSPGAFAVMGCALGGNLSLLMAAQHPEVRAVVALQGCDYTPTISPATLAMFTHPQVSLMHSGMDFTLSLLGPEASEESRQFLAWSVLSLIPLAQQGDLTAYARCDTRALMEKITCPVLMVRGGEDWIVTDEMMQATRSRIVNARELGFETLNGLGHYPMVEQPQRVTDVALPFLRRVHTEV